MAVRAVNVREIEVDVNFDRTKAMRLMMSMARPAMEHRAKTLYWIARSIAPVHTGRLKLSHEIRRKRTGRFTHSASVVATAPYAAYVHFGQHPYEPMRPQPWLKEAVERMGRSHIG